MPYLHLHFSLSGELFPNRASTVKKVSRLIDAHDWCEEFKTQAGVPQWCTAFMLAFWFNQVLQLLKVFRVFFHLYRTPSLSDIFFT